MKLDQLQSYFRDEEALFRNYSPDNVKPSPKIEPDTIENLKDCHNGDDSWCKILRVKNSG